MNDYTPGAMKDEGAVQHELAVALFDIVTDPHAMITRLEHGHLPLEGSPVVAQPVAAGEIDPDELVTIMTPAGPAKVSVNVIGTCESRSEMRMIVAGLLMHRASVLQEQTKGRELVWAITVAAMRRLEELVARDGE